MALFPTKKITALTPITPPLTGFEEFECVQMGNSRKATSRDFVLPTDSIITVSSMGGFLPGSRQLTAGIGLTFVDGGPGGTFELNATGAVAGPANPTAQVGLVAVNGVAITYMRSDAAPALDQAIAPTWTGNHIFAANQNQVRNVLPQWIFVETDAAADNQAWPIRISGEQFTIGALNDLGNVFTSWVSVDRTGTVIDSIALVSTALTWNGNPLLSTATAFANPTGTIGLATVNGVATTALRSDATPPLSQAITPTWSAQHIFSLSGATNAAILVSSAQPQVDWNETDGAANNRRWRFGVQAEQFLGQVVNDANSAAVNWLSVDRTLNVVDTISLLAGANTTSVTASQVNTNQQFRSTKDWALNNLLNYGLVVSSNNPALAFQEADAAVNNGVWDIAAIGEQLLFRTVADGVVSTVNWMVVDRTGTVVDSVTFPSEVALTNSNTVGGSYALELRSTEPGILFNETGVAADNGQWDIGASSETLRFRTIDDAYGVATNWMVVDRTGIVVDSIAWAATAASFNGIFTFTKSGSGTTAAIAINSALPGLLWRESGAAVDNRLWEIICTSESQLFRTVNDANTVAVTWLQIDRTSTAIDRVSAPAQGDNVFTVGGNALVLTGFQMGVTGGGTRGALIAKGDNTAGAAAIGAWNPATAGDNVFMTFGTETVHTIRGSITYNRGGGLTAYNTTSDVKYKKNIRNSAEASDIIDAIQVRAFDWKDSDNHLEYWLVAQELQNAYPLAVTQGTDKSDWAIDPSKLIPLMVKELQSIRNRLRLANI